MSGSLEFQPQAPNAPFDPNAGGRYFEGMDRYNFDILSSRIVPCRMLYAYIAVDLAGRFWWWDESENGQQWGLVPSDEDCLRIVGDIEQWKRVAPLAVKAIQDLSSPASDDAGTAALRKLYVLQEALFAVWEAPYSTLGRAWLYMTVTQTSRWLLPGIETPAFCPFVFSLLLHGTWDTPLSEQHIAFLRRDPMVQKFAQTGAPIFFKPGTPTADVRQRLAVIQGGRH